MRLKDGDEVQIKGSGWRGQVIALDEGDRALVRWIKADGSSEEQWYPLAGLKNVEEAASEEWEGYRDFDPNDGRSSVTGY